MNDVDYRQQQELEEERRQHGLAVLRRVTEWQHNEEDVRFLAAELGLSNDFNRRPE